MLEDAPQLRQARELFAAFPRRYWIAGGWAVDLFLRRERRPHSDVDVLILAEDLEVFGHTFGPRGIVVQDHQSGQRRPWTGPDGLEPGRHTLSVSGSPDVEVMIGLADGADWVFHRGRRARRALADITHVSEGGLPFVGPEIVLLFKARGLRDQDEQDFRDLAPRLSAEPREWLMPRLSPPGGADHPWLATLLDLRRPDFGDRGP